MSESISDSAICNKYQILEEVTLGKGAWSVVKRCHPIPPYTPPIHAASYVVKVIDKSHVASMVKTNIRNATAGILREITILHKVPRHPNIVQFIEHFETTSFFFLIFEEIPNGDLCEMILQAANGKLEEDRCRRYIFQLIQAVLHCHKHDIVHRDIKPENLLVDAADTVQLTDFGLAKEVKKDDYTPVVRTGPLDQQFLANPYADLVPKRCPCSDIIGTPRYGAPEMFLARATTGHYDGFMADAWAVGIVLYVTLTGSFPFSSGLHVSEADSYRNIMETTLHIPPTLSAEAASLLHLLLAKDPKRRVPLWDALSHPFLSVLFEPPPSLAISEFRVSHPSFVVDDNYRQLFDRVEVEVAALWYAVEALRQKLLLSRTRVTTPGTRDESRLGNRTTVPVSNGRSPARRDAPVSGRGSGGGTPKPSPSRRYSAGGGAMAVGVAIRPPGGRTTPSSVIPSSRRASPLARATPGTARRGTPTPAHYAVRATRNAVKVVGAKDIAGTVVQASGGRPSSNSRPQRNRSETPPGTQRPASGLRGERSHDAAIKSSPTLKAKLSVGRTAGVDSSLRMGDMVEYGGNKATVRFFGPTTFGAGNWVGLEMMEGNYGTHDGSSFIDKKRYFTCPKGRGVFVRPSQIKKL